MAVVWTFPCRASDVPISLRQFSQKLLVEGQIDSGVTIGWVGAFIA